MQVVPHLMTHWLTVPSVLQSLSQHWSSGEQLSPGQVASLQEARSHMAGYDLSQELFKARASNDGYARVCNHREGPSS